MGKWKEFVGKVEVEKESVHVEGEADEKENDSWEGERGIGRKER